MSQAASLASSSITTQLTALGFHTQPISKPTAGSMSGLPTSSASSSRRPPLPPSGAHTQPAPPPSTASRDGKIPSSSSAGPSSTPSSSKKRNVQPSVRREEIDLTLSDGDDDRPACPHCHKTHSTDQDIALCKFANNKIRTTVADVRTSTGIGQGAKHPKTAVLSSNVEENPTRNPRGRPAASAAPLDRPPTLSTTLSRPPVSAASSTLLTQSQASISRGKGKYRATGADGDVDMQDAMPAGHGSSRSRGPSYPLSSAATTTVDHPISAVPSKSITPRPLPLPGPTQSIADVSHADPASSSRPRPTGSPPVSQPTSELEDVEALLDAAAPSGSESSKRSSEAADELRALLERERANRAAAEARVQALEKEVEKRDAQMITERRHAKDSAESLKTAEDEVDKLSLANEALEARVDELEDCLSSSEESRSMSSQSAPADSQTPDPAEARPAKRRRVDDEEHDKDGAEKEDNDDGDSSDAASATELKPPRISLDPRYTRGLPEPLSERDDFVAFWVLKLFQPNPAARRLRHCYFCTHAPSPTSSSTLIELTPNAIEQRSIMLRECVGHLVDEHRDEWEDGICRGRFRRPAREESPEL